MTDTSADMMLVPREPTEEMVAAAMVSENWGDSKLLARVVRDVYSAMLAAAPKPDAVSDTALRVLADLADAARASRT